MTLTFFTRYHIHLAYDAKCYTTRIHRRRICLFQKKLANIIKNDSKIKEIASYLRLNIKARKDIATKEAMQQFNLSKAFDLQNYLAETYAIK